MEQSLIHRFPGLIYNLLELVYPSGIYCISCGRPIQNSLPYALCPVCVRSMKWANRETCSICGKALPVRGERGICRDCDTYPRSFDRGFACTEYGRMEREILHRFKYKDRDYYAEKLAVLMYERIGSERLEEDMLIPVPMYKPKEKRRGYNQAALLAVSLAEKLGKPCRKDLLVRVRDTKPMSGLSAGERRENLNGVFRVAEGREKELFDKTILLVDDIFTTGSTADACSLALKGAGAARVYVVVFSAGTDRGTMDP